MKNILSEKPVADLRGRLKYSTAFVNLSDINNKSILDIGCGFGWFELYLLSKTPHLVTATEITLSDLETIKKHLHDKRLHLLVADGSHLPFKNNIFNTVVSWEVLEHINKYNDIKMLKEVNRVLKKNGVLYLSTPYASAISKIFDPAWYLIGHRHYSISNIATMAEMSGFKVDEIHIKGGFWDIIQSLDLYISKWIFNRQPVFADFITEKVEKEYRSEGLNDLFVKLKKC